MYTFKISRHNNTITVRHVVRTFKIQHIGRRGPQGLTGAGVPSGGVANQVLVKNTGVDFDTIWRALTKNDVGLGQVDNTSDADKPISTAEAAALAALDPTYGQVATDMEGDSVNGMDALVAHIPTTLVGGPGQNYRSPTDAEVKDILKGLRLVSQEAGKAYSDISTTTAETHLTPYGFTVFKGVNSFRRPFVLVRSEYTYPASLNYRAWGNYYFDMSAPISVLIGAPHPQTDGNSEYIGLRTWEGIPGAMYAMSSVNRKAKDYLLAEVSTNHTGGTLTFTFRGQTTVGIAPGATTATVQSALEALSTIGTGNVIVNGGLMTSAGHMFINLSPSLYDPLNPTDTITGNSGSLTGGTFLTLENDADQAHNYNSLFSKVASTFSSEGYAQLQLHGYADVSSSVPRVFGAILSNGSSNTTKLLELVRSNLEADGFDVGLKGSYSTQGLYVTGDPTGGSIVLRYNSINTSAIAYSTTATTFAANVQAALEAHASIGTGNVAVTLSSNNNTGISATLVITFKGALYHLGTGAITVQTNSLTGGTAPAAVCITADDTALTATSNTQGDIAEAYGTSFIHLELSATVRTSTTLSARLVGALSNLNLPQLSAAALPVLAELGHTVSQTPVTIGTAATIGVSPAVARADHIHRWSPDAAAANYFAARNSGNTGNTWLSPADAKTNLVLTKDDVGLGNVPNIDTSNLGPRTFTKIVGTTGMTADYICDGVADEVQINQAITAVNAAGGGAVLIRSGSYHITSNAIVPMNNTHIRGEGMFSTKLLADSTLNKGIFDNYTASTFDNPTRNMIISDMELDGSGFSRTSGQYKKGINSRNWYNCMVLNVYCHDCTATGIGPDNLYQSIIANCIVTNNGTAAQPARSTLTSDNTNPANGDTVSVGSLYASVLLTSDGTNVADGETATLGSVTYTFKTALASTANQVLIGSSAAITLDNLLAAVNRATGAGAKYTSATVANPDITATTNTNTTQKFVAKLNGTNGNSLASTETSTHLSFASSTLLGGTNTVYRFVNSLSAAYDVLVGATADDTLTNLAAAINGTAGAGATYGTDTVANELVSAGSVATHAIVISALGTGAATNTITVAESSAHLSFDDATLTDGQNQLIGHNGIGVATGGLPSESFIITNNFALNNANNNYLIEADTNNTGAEAMYICSNNVSSGSPGNAFRNSGTPNVVFTNNTIYAPTKSGFYISDATAAHPSTNNIIKNNLIIGCGIYGIYQGRTCDDFNIEGNAVRDCVTDGIIVGANNGSIINNRTHDNGRYGINLGAFGGAPAALHDVIISGNVVESNGKITNNTDGIFVHANNQGISDVIITNNRCLDAQTVKTQRYGIILPTSSGGFTMSDILVANNNVNGNNTGGILKQNASTSISVVNNIGHNPQQSYVHGNISGATTFSRLNGSTQLATLIGNVTATVAAGSVPGDTMTLVLTQDATGSRTISWPVNVKVANTSVGLILSTAASAVDVINFTWDGTNWRELSRSLATTKLTIRDGFTVVTPDASGLVGLTVTQSDVTNNPNLATFTNSGTGNGVSISQNGVLASSKYGLFIDSNAVQVNSPLMRIRQQNASATQAGLQITNSGSGAALDVTAGNISLTGGVNIAASATTGSQIATATTQKIGFWGTTPVAQQSGNLVTALGNIGLVVSGTIDASNITTGTLAVAQGGTGSATKNFVDLTTAQTPIAGAKTFTADMTISDATLTVGTSTDVFSAAVKIARNAINIGQIDNNANGLRVRALTNSLQLANNTATIISISSVGLITITDASDMALSTGTGTKIGTSTSQKLGFWNATPVVQQSGNIVTALGTIGLVANGTINNSNITQRISTVASSAAPTPNCDTDDLYTVTALAVGATFGAPTGTPAGGQKLMIRIKDNGSAQTLAWNAIYRFSSDLAAPATTIISKTLYLGFIYNSTDSKWDCLALLNNF